MDSVIYLKDISGKILAEFKMSMNDGPAAMRFFRDCNQGKLMDEYGKTLPCFPIVVTKRPGTEEHV